MKGKENLEKSNKYIFKTQLEKVLLHSPNPKRLMVIIEFSKIILVEK
jgi:hypothetical protein